MVQDPEQLSRLRQRGIHVQLGLPRPGHLAVDSATTLSATPKRDVPFCSTTMRRYRSRLRQTNHTGVSSTILSADPG